MVAAKKFSQVVEEKGYRIFHMIAGRPNKTTAVILPGPVCDFLGHILSPQSLCGFSSTIITVSSKILPTIASLEGKICNSKLLFLVVLFRLAPPFVDTTGSKQAYAAKYFTP
jgi:hypothetical protein